MEQSPVPSSLDASPLPGPMEVEKADQSWGAAAPPLAHAEASGSENEEISGMAGPSLADQKSFFKSATLPAAALRPCATAASQPAAKPLRARPSDSGGPASSGSPESAGSVSTGAGSPCPAKAEDGEEAAGEEGGAGSQLQHHLLRHSLPTDLRGPAMWAYFGADSAREAARAIRRMSQRELQATFLAVYGTRTFSNNNNWLRRKLYEAVGVDVGRAGGRRGGAGRGGRGVRAPRGGGKKPKTPASSTPRQAGRRPPEELGGEEPAWLNPAGSDALAPAPSSSRARRAKGLQPVGERANMTQEDAAVALLALADVAGAAYEAQGLVPGATGAAGTKPAVSRPAQGDLGALASPFVTDAELPEAPAPPSARPAKSGSSGLSAGGCMPPVPSIRALRQLDPALDSDHTPSPLSARGDAWALVGWQGGALRSAESAAKKARHGNEPSGLGPAEPSLASELRRMDLEGAAQARHGSLPAASGAFRRLQPGPEDGRALSISLNPSGSFGQEPSPILMPYFEPGESSRLIAADPSSPGKHRCASSLAGEAAAAPRTHPFRPSTPPAPAPTHSPQFRAGLTRAAAEGCARDAASRGLAPLPGAWGGASQARRCPLVIRPTPIMAPRRAVPSEGGPAAQGSLAPAPPLWLSAPLGAGAALPEVLARCINPELCKALLAQGGMPLTQETSRPQTPGHVLQSAPPAARPYPSRASLHGL